MVMPMTSGERTSPMKNTATMNMNRNRKREVPPAGWIWYSPSSSVWLREMPNSMSGYILVKIVSGFLQFLTQIVHVLLTLLDDGQRHGTLSSGKRASRLVSGNGLHIADVAEIASHSPLRLKQMSSTSSGVKKNRGYTYVVFIRSVTHKHASRLHIVR